MFIGIKKSTVLDAFRYHHTFTCGEPRSGKGMFISYILRLRNAPHYCNFPMDKNTIVQPITYFSIAPNTFDNFINGNVQLIDKKWLENIDIYFDETNSILPSCQYKELDRNKTMVGVSCFCAYSGHISNSNVHLVGQLYSKTWDKMRLFCTRWFKALRTWHFGRLFVTKLTYYTNENSLVNNVLPLKVPILPNQRVRMEKQKFDSLNGVIKNFFLVQILPKEHYDSRIIHKSLFGFPAPITAKKK